MFRQIIIFVAVFMVGQITSRDLFIPEFDDFNDLNDNFNVEINGDLLIDSTSNTNNEIAHQQIHFEHMRLVKDVDGILHYSIGARVSNDRLVASGGQNQTWPAPHNVNIQLTYPTQGYGATVTYVAIVVNQTSNLGQAYIVKGGINQRMISIVVEGYNTYVFNIMAYVYGV